MGQKEEGQLWAKKRISLSFFSFFFFCFFCFLFLFLFFFFSCLASFEYTRPNMETKGNYNVGWVQALGVDNGRSRRI
jgi:hypothetical protein